MLQSNVSWPYTPVIDRQPPSSSGGDIRSSRSQCYSCAALLQARIHARCDECSTAAAHSCELISQTSSKMCSTLQPRAPPTNGMQVPSRLVHFVIWHLSGQAGKSSCCPAPRACCQSALVSFIAAYCAGPCIRGSSLKICAMQELRAANAELKAQLARLQRDSSISQTAARDEVAEARQQLGDERAAADSARRQAAEAARGRQEADEAHHARIHDLQKRCS